MKTTWIPVSEATQADITRFWSKVIKGPSCWEWQGLKRAPGYGLFKLRGRMFYAHRVAYEFLVGPIPEGLVLDHLCRSHSCVNPSHLQPVSNGENVLRGIGTAAVNARGMKCAKGHDFDAVQHYRRKGVLKTKRICTECRRAVWRKYARKAYAAKKQTQ